ncbi:caspase, EACC1-associated type [Nocardia sp. CA-129566]|uniref:caspase, EACC1-associated type n=1 Tax=Nocardia sp. CA-129566 TaxID=3239976 RepID=UPI003D96BDCA
MANVQKSSKSRPARRRASDVLLVYYAGHGLLDQRGRLHLALPDTDPSRIRWTALPYETLREELGNSHAATRIVLLDCCFSGRAIDAMASAASAVAGQIDIDGTYIITPTAANRTPNAPPGQPYTAFTAALLTAAETEHDLTLDDLFTNVDRILHTRSSTTTAPRGQQSRTTSHLQITYTPNESHAHTSTAHRQHRRPAEHVGIAISGRDRAALPAN